MAGLHTKDLERIIRRGERYEYESVDPYEVECPKCGAPAGKIKRRGELTTEFNCRLATGKPRDFHTHHPGRRSAAEAERESRVEAGRQALAEIERREQMFRDMQRDTAGKCKWFTLRSLDGERDAQTLFGEAEQTALF